MCYVALGQRGKKNHGQALVFQRGTNVEVFTVVVAKTCMLELVFITFTRGSREQRAVLIPFLV